jgi:MHS family proline/betaine transporter-like MFS transporter
MIAVVALAILPVLWRIPETAPSRGWAPRPLPV